MSNIVEIIKVIEANLNTLHEQMNNLELEVTNLRKDLNELKSYVINDQPINGGK